MVAVAWNSPSRSDGILRKCSVGGELDLRCAKDELVPAQVSGAPQWFMYCAVAEIGSAVSGTSSIFDVAKMT